YFPGGNAGNVDVEVLGHVELSQSGMIISETRGSGNGGQLAINAGSMTIDANSSRDLLGTGVFANSGYLGRRTGVAGSVNIEVQGELQVVNYGKIRSAAPPSDSTPAIRVSAASLRLG